MGASTLISTQNKFRTYQPGDCAQMAERYDGNFSFFVSKTLNNNGYSWQAICRRRDGMKTIERLGNRCAAGTGLSFIQAGSAREGACKLYGSDFDTMIVLDEVICREDFLDFESRRAMTFFDIDFHGCPPGYAHLTLVKHGGRIFMNGHTNESARVLLKEVIENSCHGSESGKLHFNNDMFMKIWDILIQAESNNHHPVFEVRKPRAGPSSPSTVPNHFLNLEIDNVPSFPCHCPSLFEKFRNRPRRHGWPSPYLLQELAQLDAHAVAVGDKMSGDHYTQWRICFTQAEIRLIESFTEPQINVFVLLKIFTKDVLKKIWDKMTSYVVKNLILWMAELTPTNKFQTDTIVERFIDCLFFLKICVKAGFLPNYMISERNLLRHEHFIVKRKQLLSVLEDCMYEKGCCLLKSDTLKEALLETYSRPEVALQRGIDRDTYDQMNSAIQEEMHELVLEIKPEILRSPTFTLIDYLDMPRLVRLVRCVFSSVGASEIVNLVQRSIFFASENVSVEEMLRDPARAVKQIIDKTVSYVK